MLFIRSGIVLGAVALLTVAVVPARADKCTAAKLKAIANKEAGLLTCHANTVKKGDSSLQPCVDKVEGRYAAAFPKAGSCSGLQAVCECFVKNCEASVLGSAMGAQLDACDAIGL